MPDAFHARRAPKRHSLAIPPTRKSHYLAALSLSLVLAPASRAQTPAQDPRALIEQAKDQYRNGHFADAIASYQAALKIAPHNITAEVQLAEAYRAVHNEKEARGLLEQSRPRTPQKRSPAGRPGRSRNRDANLRCRHKASKRSRSARSCQQRIARPAGRGLQIQRRRRRRPGATHKIPSPRSQRRTRPFPARPNLRRPQRRRAGATRGRKSPHATAAKSQRPHDTRENSYPHVRDSGRRNCNSRLRARRRARTTHH